MENEHVEMVQSPFLLTAHLLHRTLVSAERSFIYSKLSRTILTMKSKCF